MPPFFSANAHVIEPPNVFDGRVPRKWADRVPRLVIGETGGHEWIFEGQTLGLLHRTCCMAGAIEEGAWRSDVEGFNSIATLDELRPGCHDAAQRVEDMDVDGVHVAACTSDPSGMGFAGDLFSYATDPEFGLACLRAWNDWYLEEWVGAAPERFVPIGCTSYIDPEAAAEEVRRNADRGFRGVAFRNPTDLAQPWFGTGHWDPLLRACEETGTVLVHHTEALPWFPRREIEGAAFPYGMTLTLYQSCAMDFLAACLWGGVTSRFPELRIMIAESGGSWLPHFLRRLDWNQEHSVLTRAGWPDKDRTPLEMLQQSCWFSTQELDLVTSLGDEFGIARWMFEDDYPHIESIWPDTAKKFAEDTADFDPDTVERVAWRTASELFRFPLPEGVRSGAGTSAER